MGIIQLARLHDYWLTNSINNIPFFRRVMSQDRFFQMLGMLHVGEINEPRKMLKVQPFIDLLLPIIQSNYNLGKQIAVDEAVITF